MPSVNYLITLAPIKHAFFVKIFDGSMTGNIKRFLSGPYQSKRNCSINNFQLPLIQEKTVSLENMMSPEYLQHSSHAWILILFGRIFKILKELQVGLDKGLCSRKKLVGMVIY